MPSADWVDSWAPSSQWTDSKRNLRNSLKYVETVHKTYYIILWYEGIRVLPLGTMLRSFGATHGAASLRPLGFSRRQAYG